MKKAMVVCPTSLVLNWAAEVKKWLEGSLSPIIVTSDLKKEKVVQKLLQFQASARAPSPTPSDPLDRGR